MTRPSASRERGAGERPGTPGPGGVQWASPQVLLPLLAVLVAAVTFVRADPPSAEPAPDLRVQASEPLDPPRDEETLYVVGEDGAARPVRRELAQPESEGARLQGIVEALREVMVEEEIWPSELPVPRVFALEVERRAAAVLDLPPHEAPLDVARERRILESIERTLLEQGIERTAYLRDGRAGGPWPDHLAAPSTLD